MRYAIGVGSNRGDRRGLIAAAAEHLTADGQVRLLAAAALWENPAVGGPPGQGPFLNGAWVVATGLGPHGLLARLQRVEAVLGRCRSVPWGPRTIDLDLLLAEDGRQVDSAVLRLPHPGLADRLFVLRPLAAVAGDWRHPERGATVAELLAAAQSGGRAAVLPTPDRDHRS